MTCPVCAKHDCLGECMDLWPVIPQTATIEGKTVLVGDALYLRGDNIYGRKVIVVDAIVRKNFEGKPSLLVHANGWPDDAPCTLESLAWTQPMDPSFVKWYTDKYGHDPELVIDPNHKTRNGQMHEI